MSSGGRGATLAEDSTSDPNPVGFNDANGEQLTYRYQWLRNGTPIAGASGNTLDLSTPGNGDHGDLIRVQIYAVDASGANSAAVADQVTVANSAPTAGAVKIAPSSPKPTAIVTAAPSGFRDPDGDKLTYQYQCSINGKLVAGATGRTLDLTRKTHVKGGDSVRAEVIAIDSPGGRSGVASTQVKITATKPITLSRRAFADGGFRLTVSVPPRTRVLDFTLCRAARRARSSCTAGSSCKRIGGIPRPRPWALPMLALDRAETI